MIPYALLQKHFAGNEPALEIVHTHSKMVAQKALTIAKGAGLAASELSFIEEAALLHDIGVGRVDAPRMHCFGEAPYICHGILGREILESEGLPRHALVCERHIGVGLTPQDILDQKLPLPPREMSPVSAAERIVALADLFYSKRVGQLEKEKSLEQVRAELGRFGSHKLRILESWLGEFGLL